MLSVEEAQEELIHQAKKLLAEKADQTAYVSLDEACGRVISELSIATVDIPPGDNSAMDGYAVRAEDITKTPMNLNVSQRLAAGTDPRPLVPRTAARIFTGAEIPEGADAVVMQENCETGIRSVYILSAPKKYENIRRKGQDIKKGETIATPGTRLNPAHVGLLASTGQIDARVYPKIKIALFSTGDELVSPGSPIKKGQIYNSNQFTLTSLINGPGVSIKSIQHIPDNLAKTEHMLREAAKDVDLIITTGGVSVGEEDHLKAAIENMGRVSLWKVALKPGKPITYGTIEHANEGKRKQTPVIGLPGNPTSAYVTYLLFAKPFLRALQGEAFELPSPFWETINFDIDKSRSRREYLRVKRTHEGLEAYENQSSGVLSSLAWADGLALVEEGKTYKKGDKIAFFPLDLL